MCPDCASAWAARRVSMARASLHSSSNLQMQKQLAKQKDTLNYLSEELTSLQELESQKQELARRVKAKKQVEFIKQRLHHYVQVQKEKQRKKMNGEENADESRR